MIKDLRSVGIIASLGLLSLSACSLTGSAGLQAAPGVASGLTNGVISTLDSFDQAIDQEILNRKARIHNLQVGLGQIDATPGMVVSVPTIIGVGVATTTTTPVNPTPVIPVTPSTPLTPIAPPTPVTPTTPSGSPIVTPN